MFDQPDLFAATPEDLRSEVRRHGGGTPPRWIAPAEPEFEDDRSFSPVQFAEALRQGERLTGTVSIRRVSLARLAEQLV